ncbi:MAG: tRNA lysidine(34) synthetase TilS [Geminicoccaceae bacterium]
MKRAPRAAAEPDGPLSHLEFAELLQPVEPFEPGPRIAVGVSGGPDSTALALLADRWVRDRHGSILALVVDHGLRPESAAEAALVAERLDSRGIAVRVLTWSGPSPASGIQAAAREARMLLLGSACRELGILHLMLGHQREDQAETVVIRSSRGSGETGRAGMAVVREVQGFRLLRPLLGIRRRRLVATLHAMGEPWIEDPSNRDLRFARARLRCEPGLDHELSWRMGRTCAEHRAAADERIAHRLASAARPHPLGFVACDVTAWRRLDARDRADVLARLLACVGGGRFPVARAKILALLGEPTTAARTLGGCIVFVRRGAPVVCREPARIRDRSRLASGDEVAWDRRFVLRAGNLPAMLEIRALGRVGRAALPAVLRRSLRAAGIPVAAVEALPGAWIGDELVACPALGLAAASGFGDFSLTATFRPAYPLTAARFAGVNVVSNAQPPIYRSDVDAVSPLDGPCVSGE